MKTIVLSLLFTFGVWAQEMDLLSQPVGCDVQSLARGRGATLSVQCVNKSGKLRDDAPVARMIIEVKNSQGEVIDTVTVENPTLSARAAYGDLERVLPEDYQLPSGSTLELAEHGLFLSPDTVLYADHAGTQVSHERIGSDGSGNCQLAGEWTKTSISTSKLLPSDGRSCPRNGVARCLGEQIVQCEGTMQCADDPTFGSNHFQVWCMAGANNICPNIYACANDESLDAFKEEAQEQGFELVEEAAAAVAQ